MKKLIYNTAGVVFIALVSVAMMDYAFSTPTVITSYSTGNCVAVENYPGAFFNTNSNFTCENLPNKYNHVYAK